MNRRVVVVLSVAALLAVAAGIFIFGGFGGGGQESNGYEITVWKDGKVERVVNADSYSAKGDTIAYHLAKPDAEGKTTGQASGTWVVKHHDWKPEAAEQKFKATLFSGDQVVGTWYIREFVTGERSVILFPADGSEALRVCGNLVIEELASQSAGEATQRVTLTSGGKSVYTRELIGTTIVGHYVTGHPADGSGAVYIWGDYKIEEVKK